MRACRFSARFQVFVVVPYYRTVPLVVRPTDTIEMVLFLLQAEVDQEAMPFDILNGCFLECESRLLCPYLNPAGGLYTVADYGIQHVSV